LFSLDVFFIDSKPAVVRILSL